MGHVTAAAGSSCEESDHASPSACSAESRGSLEAVPGLPHPPHLTGLPPDGSLHVDQMQASPSSSKNGDGMLSWMEAYAANLAAGKYSLERLIEQDDASTTITLYPRQGRGTSEAVTQGIKVAAGAALIPERSNPPEMFFSYR